VAYVRQAGGDQSDFPFFPIGGIARSNWERWWLAGARQQIAVWCGAVDGGQRMLARPAASCLRDPAGPQAHEATEPR